MASMSFDKFNVQMAIKSFKPVVLKDIYKVLSISEYIVLRIQLIIMALKSIGLTILGGHSLPVVVWRGNVHMLRSYRSHSNAKIKHLRKFPSKTEFS